MILYDTVTVIYVLVCFLLLLVVLLQQGKGDMGSAFGGGGSQTAFGARSGATLLTKMTTICAVLFMVGALILAILGQRGPRSIVSGTPGPAPAPASTAPTPATAPAGTPAPAPAPAPTPAK
jgi:preprotein translocase subunit SecG